MYKLLFFLPLIAAATPISTSGPFGYCYNGTCHDFTQQGSNWVGPDGETYFAGSAMTAEDGFLEIGAWQAGSSFRAPAGSTFYGSFLVQGSGDLYVTPRGPYPGDQWDFTAAWEVGMICWEGGGQLPVPPINFSATVDGVPIGTRMNLSLNETYRFHYDYSYSIPADIGASFGWMQWGVNDPQADLNPVDRVPFYYQYSTAAPVPEPSTWLLGLTAGGMLLWRKRKGPGRFSTAALFGMPPLSGVLNHPALNGAVETQFRLTR